MLFPNTTPELSTLISFSALDVLTMLPTRGRTPVFSHIYVCRPAACQGLALKEFCLRLLNL